MADRSAPLELYELAEIGNGCIYARVGIVERCAVYGVGEELACNGGLGDETRVAAVCCLFISRVKVPH